MRKLIIILCLLLNIMLNIKQGLGQLANNSEEKQKTPLFTIPVVVHVLYKEDFQNIPEEQIIDGINVLNKDFQLKNDDSDNCPERFNSLQANCQIGFRLALRDPNGNPTTGIIRKKTNKTFFTKPGDIIRGRDADDAKFSHLGGDDIWDRNKYLNIWIVPAIRDGKKTHKGYAQAPYQAFSNSSLTDGVVIEYNWFGINKHKKGISALGLGRTATHEVGHWLNLKHIWNYSCLYTDDVEDTPRQSASHRDICPDGIVISCNNEPNGDMYMNFMDETSDECMNMFTLGQKQRMHELFKPGGYRYSLLFSDGCSNPQTSNENANRTSKDPKCNENQNGDFCFQNNTELDLIVNFHFNSNIKSRYQISPFSLTLKPGQKQCFFEVPVGASRYEIKSLAKVYGYGSTAPKVNDYNAEGTVYVDRCKENNFIINLDKPSYSTSNPASNSSKSKEETCIVSSTGDLCFKNETKSDLKVRLLSSPIPGTSGWNQIIQYDCTLQPGQTQCFFGVPSGLASYEIFSPVKVYGYGSTAPKAEDNDGKGQIYVETCKTVFFNIK